MSGKITIGVGEPLRRHAGAAATYQFYTKADPCQSAVPTVDPGVQAVVALADAVTVLFARVQHLADHGKREWQPSPAMPALVVIIDEYAELADDAPEAMRDTDTIARLGRAPAVTLVAATQRPTQKVMGQGAVRSQMNIRIAFRVEEQRDVDLILGQGRLKAGWHAHKLNALPAAPARRRRLRRPDRTRLLAHAAMTIRNRECKVQVHALTRVCTYGGVISSCTCTKGRRRSVTNRNHGTPRSRPIRRSHYE